MQIQIPSLSHNPGFEGPTRQQLHGLQPISQPNLSAYSELQSRRYIISAPPQIHLGGTVQPTFSVPLVSQPDSYHFERVRQSIRNNPEIAKSFIGPTSQQTYPVPLPLQPQFAYYKADTNRFIIGPKSQLDGPTAQQTYIFQLSQPKINGLMRVDRSRYLTEVKFWTDSLATIVAQQYLFPVSEPELSYYRIQSSRYLVEVKEWIGDLAAAIPQHYIFPVSQPELNRILKELNRSEYLVEAPKYFYGATNQPTYPVPGVSGPDPHYGMRLDRIYYLGPKQQFEGEVAAPPTSVLVYIWKRII